MFKEADIYLRRADLENYLEWLNLDIEAITWHGRYRREFEQFLEDFLLHEQYPREVFDRFNLAILNLKVGSLISWFTWLRNRLVAFIFFEKNISVLSLSNQSKLSLGETSTILMDFFLENNPYLYKELSEIFQIVHISNKNTNLNFEELKKLFPQEIKTDLVKSEHDSVMTSMEVTLYDEWRYIAKRIRKSLHHPQFNFKKSYSKINFRKYLKIFRDLLAMGAVGCLLIFIVKEINGRWNQALIDKISIYERHFKWLDKTSSFQDKNEDLYNNLKLPPQELESVEQQKDARLHGKVQDEVRYEVESEAVLSSWHKLPKDFDVAELEKSEYEENRITGYRDSRYGSTRVYRVMMRSVDIPSTKENLNFLLKKYKVTRVDNVRPGKSVPGGIYYNIFVPRNYLKEFIAQVMEMDDAVLYESRTRAGRNPPMKNKVFIWVKTI